MKYLLPDELTDAEKRERAERRLWKLLICLVVGGLYGLMLGYCVGWP